MDGPLVFVSASQRRSVETASWNSTAETAAATATATVATARSAADTLRQIAVAAAAEDVQLLSDVRARARAPAHHPDQTSVQRHVVLHHAHSHHPPASPTTDHPLCRHQLSLPRVHALRCHRAAASSWPMPPTPLPLRSIKSPIPLPRRHLRHRARRDLCHTTSRSGPMACRCLLHRHSIPDHGHRRLHLGQAVLCYRHSLGEGSCRRRRWRLPGWAKAGIRRGRRGTRRASISKDSKVTRRGSRDTVGMREEGMDETAAATEVDGNKAVETRGEILDDMVECSKSSLCFQT